MTVESALTFRRLPIPSPRTVLRTTGPSGRAALGFYRPQTWRGRSLSLLSRWLLDTPLGPQVNVGNDLDSRLRALLDRLDTDSSRGAALLQSSRDGRWIAGLAAGGTLQAIAKMGPPSDAGLEVETRSLERGLKGKSWRMPRLKPGWSTPGTLVTEWHSGECQMDPAPILGICRDLQHHAVRHGDLTAWNVINTPSGQVVLDWETARWNCTHPGFDLIHYHTKRSLLLDGRPADRLIDDLLSPAGWLVQLLEPIHSEPKNAILSYLTFEHSGDRSPGAVEYRRAMLAALRVRTATT